MRGTILLLLFLSFTSYGQNDSISVFSYIEFLKIVGEHHPMAYQANLQQRLGDAYVQKARGGFDPKLYGNAQQKYYDGKQYYSYLNAGLKIPTWFGVSLQGGVDQNNGERLNSESYTNDIPLWHAGITANLGNGMFIDQRRADIKQAKIYQNSTEQEQKLMVNQLFLDASVSYFNWFKAYNKVKVYENAVRVAQERFENTKSTAELGDKPYVDTLKALIQVQDRSLKLEQAKLDLVNKRNLLETFLWQDGFAPLEISENLVPNLYPNLAIESPALNLVDGLDTLVQRHPEIIMSQNKIDINKIDYRLQREALKPTLEVKYNALAGDLGQGVIDDYTIENYNWGATFVYPIFTRKERANVEISRIKVENEEANLAQKEALIKYKILASYNNWESTVEQVNIMQIAANNYQALYFAELALFNAGESSMFLVNVRDQDYIDAQIKLIDIITIHLFNEANFKFQTMNF